MRKANMDTIIGYVHTVTKKASKKYKTATIQATRINAAIASTTPALAQSQFTSTPAYQPPNAGLEMRLLQSTFAIGSEHLRRLAISCQ